MSKIDVPIWEKAAMTFEEASAYSNIGINRLREISCEPGCNFVIYVGRKRLIKRKKFDEYLDRITII